MIDARSTTALVLALGLAHAKVAAADPGPPTSRPGCTLSTGAALAQAGKVDEAVACWRGLLPLARTVAERNSLIVSIERTSLRPDQDLSGVTLLQVEIANAWARSVDDARRAASICNLQCTVQYEACLAKVPLSSCGETLVACSQACGSPGG
ncbi:MAG TPA: hypothetical protein VMB50_06240 [Myxococcales bacterium]|nr:hypothetical protein [Myxococcales bacterium]